MGGGAPSPPHTPCTVSSAVGLVGVTCFAPTPVGLVGVTFVAPPIRYDSVFFYYWLEKSFAFGETFFDPINLKKAIKKKGL